MTFSFSSDIKEKDHIMKNKYVMIGLVLSIFLFSCSKDEAGTTTEQVQQVTSQVCANVNGFEAIYWDFAHSILVPLTEVPLIKNPGQQFIHSLHPLIGFTIPQGFSGFEITEPQTATLGVNVIRNDNAVVFRWIPNTQVAGQISATNLIADEINGMFDFYGFNGTPDVVCTTTANSTFEGIPSQFTARLLRFGGITAQIWVRSTFIAGGTFSAVSITAAPTAEYNTQVIETFLPINFQLFVGGDGGFVDNDGDGVPANEDPDDNNRNVP